MARMPWDEPPDPEPAGQSSDEVAFLLERQEELLIAVATGAPMTDYESEYRRRREKLVAAFQRLDMPDPYPWRTLAQFWARARQHATYAERRGWVSDLATPAMDFLKGTGDTATSVTDIGVPPTERWRELEARLADLKDELARAHSLDDLQDVGRRGREILIAAVNLCYGHVRDDDPPKTGDAKERFDRIMAQLASGVAHAELRKVMRASWDLVQKVTHSASIDAVDALASAQSVVLLVRCLQEIDKQVSTQRA